MEVASSWRRERDKWTQLVRRSASKSAPRAISNPESKQFISLVYTSTHPSHVHQLGRQRKSGVSVPPGVDLTHTRRVRRDTARPKPASRRSAMGFPFFLICSSIFTFLLALSCDIRVVCFRYFHSVFSFIIPLSAFQQDLRMFAEQAISYS